MKKILLFSLGGGVGYVLGARAGRPAYDRLVPQWKQAATTLGISDFAASLRDAGVHVPDSTVSRATDAVSTSADHAVQNIAPAAATYGGHDAARRTTTRGPSASDRDTVGGDSRGY